MAGYLPESVTKNNMKKQRKHKKQIDNSTQDGLAGRDGSMHEYYANNI
jgi:hypothetical protein